MAGYYGISNFTDGFNRTRDDGLASGFKAKDRMRNDYLADYRMPEHMTASDANTALNSIKADTFNGAYGDMVGVGLNQAKTDNKQTGINLQQVQAGDDKNAIRARAIQNGARNEGEILDYALKNERHIINANPHLGSKFYDDQQKYYQGMKLFGAAAGGGYGRMLQNKAAPYGIYGSDATFQKDANGNAYMANSEGQRSGPVSIAGQIALAKAGYGDVGPASAYYNQLEQRQMQKASEEARLQAQVDIYQGRRQGSGNGSEAKISDKIRLAEQYAKAGDQVTAMRILNSAQLDAGISDGGIKLDDIYSGSTSSQVGQLPIAAMYTPAEQQTTLPISAQTQPAQNAAAYIKQSDSEVNKLANETDSGKLRDMYASLFQKLSKERLSNPGQGFNKKDYEQLERLRLAIEAQRAKVEQRRLAEAQQTIDKVNPLVEQYLKNNSYGF